MPETQPVGGDLVERLRAAQMLVGGDHNGQVVSRPDPLAQEAATTIEALRSRAEAAERALEELKAEAVEVVLPMALAAERADARATRVPMPGWWDVAQEYLSAQHLRRAADFLSRLRSEGGSGNE